MFMEDYGAVVFGGLLRYCEVLGALLSCMDVSGGLLFQFRVAMHILNLFW